MDKFTTAYVECALWTSTDPDGEPMDATYNESDLSSACLEEMKEECACFQNDNDHLFEGKEEQAGHDFWLSRNGHGSGFFDGPWKAADELQKAAKVWGSYDLYVGDDGKIYGQ